MKFLVLVVGFSLCGDRCVLVRLYEGRFEWEGCWVLEWNW